MQLPNLIREWATARNLILGSNSQAQMVKLMEEVGELAHGIAKNKPDEIQDAIGDCFVVLTILAAQNGMMIEDCIESAYNQIKNRKGKNIDGVFVREES